MIVGTKKKSQKKSDTEIQNAWQRPLYGTVESEATSSDAHAKPRPSLLELFKAYQADIVQQLLAREPVKHSLTKVQFLIDRIQEEDSPIKDTDVTDAAKYQAHHINTYQLINSAFAEKQEIIGEYIALIRLELKDRPVTPENIMLVMKELSSSISPGRLFTTFVNHCCHSKNLLEALAHEVQYSKPDEALTTEDISAANEAWQKIDNERYKRLTQKMSGIMERVERWHAIIPSPLSDKAVEERERLNPYKFGEDAKYRAERQRLVPGHSASLRQIQQRAVAQEAARSYAKAKQPLEKQHCELEDAVRLEMQFQLGIRPFSKSRQSYGSLVVNTVTGGQSWQTSFKGAMLDPDMPESFPERKEFAAKTLLPLMQLRCVANKKLLDSSIESNDAVDAVVDNLRRLKISQ